MTPEQRHQDSQEFHLDRSIRQVVNTMSPLLPDNLTWVDLIPVFQELKSVVNSRLTYSYLISNCITMLSQFYPEDPYDRAAYELFEEFIAVEYNDLEEDSEMSEYEPEGSEPEDNSVPAIDRE